MILVAAFPVAARATTAVPMTVRDLVAVSAAALRARVSRIGSGVDPDRGAVHTYIVLTPEEVFFGTLPDGEVVLRELGGRAGGRRQWVFGNPEYRVGEPVLVFVSVAADGSMHTTGLALGKFTLVDGPGGARAVRELPAELTLRAADGTVAPAAAGAEEHPLSALRADVRRFADATAAGRRRPPVPAQQVARRRLLEPRTAFILLNPFSRWFDPDDGRAVSFFVDTTGDDTLGPVVSQETVDQSLAAWSGRDGSPLVLDRAGDAGPAPFAGCPDDNRIVFNDPFGELDNPTSCRGILAVGGFCNSGETRTVNDTDFLRIITGKVTVNDGWGSCPIWTPCNLAEIITHELGHTLGLGHSSDPTATMARVAHFDGRCASLAADDDQAIAFVYPFPPTPTATPTVTPSPPPSPTVTRTGTSSSTPTRTVTAAPTTPPSPTRTLSSTLTPSVTPTSTPTERPSQTPTSSPTPAATPTPTARPWIGVLSEALRRTLDAVRYSKR